MWGGSIGWHRLGRIMAGHILPGVATQLLIVATLDIGAMIAVIAGLSFLSLGVQPPTAEWGAMLADSRFYFTLALWLLLGPACRSFSRWSRRICLATRCATCSTQEGPHEPAGVLQYENLRVTYASGMQAVRGVSLSLQAGACLALVGESGCGKTTLARAALGLLPGSAVISGSIRVGGAEVVRATPHALRALRGHVLGYVAQGPFEACSPLDRVEGHVAEAWLAHRQPLYARATVGHAARRAWPAPPAGRHSAAPERADPGLHVCAALRLQAA